MEHRRVDPPLARQQRQYRAIKLNPAGRGEVEGPADAAACQRGHCRCFGLGKIRAIARQQFADNVPRQRRQRLAAAARANRRQQPPRTVRDQQEQRAAWCFLEDLQQRVRRVAVHLVGAIDDDDAPTPLSRGQSQKDADLTRVDDDDLAAQAAAPRVVGALDG